MHVTATFELHDPTDAPLFADDVGGTPTGRRSFDKTFAGITGTGLIRFEDDGTHVFELDDEVVPPEDTPADASP